MAPATSKFSSKAGQGSPAKGSQGHASSISSEPGTTRQHFGVLVKRQKTEDSLDADSQGERSVRQKTTVASGPVAESQVPPSLRAKLWASGREPAGTVGQ